MEGSESEPRGANANNPAVMPKEKWYERKPVPVELLTEIISLLGTHATTVRVVEELKARGFKSEEDILSALMDARRKGVLVLMIDGWWRWKVS